MQICATQWRQENNHGQTQGLVAAVGLMMCGSVFHWCRSFAAGDFANFFSQNCSKRYNHQTLVKLGIFWFLCEFRCLKYFGKICNMLQEATRSYSFLLAPRSEWILVWFDCVFTECILAYSSWMKVTKVNRNGTTSVAPSIGKLGILKHCVSFVHFPRSTCFFSTAWKHFDSGVQTLAFATLWALLASVAFLGQVSFRDGFWAWLSIL